MSLFDTQTAMIMPEDIVVGRSIKNIRTVFQDEAIQQLAESIRRDGLMQPLVVMEGEDDDGESITELIAGERRLRAILMVRAQDPDFMKSGVPCITYEGTLHEAKYINAVENVERENIDDVDLSTWIAGRIGEGVSQTELGERLHRSPSWVNFRMVFHAQAADAVKQAVRDGLISFSAAYHLAKNLNQEEQIKWINKARKLNEKISVEAAAAAGDPDKVVRPNKKARARMLKRADDLADNGNDIGRGMSLALRWVEGYLEDEEMQDMVGFEETK
jgi:ParB family chromosome partitioning protein